MMPRNEKVDLIKMRCEAVSFVRWRPLHARSDSGWFGTHLFGGSFEWLSKGSDCDCAARRRQQSNDGC